MTKKKHGKRIYLNDTKMKDMIQALTSFFESYVQISRICVGNQQTLETLINEEALLFAKYLRHERKQWEPRIITK